ncbi:PREDICTED: bromodomain-containing protein 9-like [Brassica oleracea var. oleracea]|uniref:Bromo domain-containing protein n=1 Tax=Brassica oleracea var. oleracea TaxID=109376 RepID=A0A0D3CBU7_BRAOL|nr:PREDICTED: bromodomain-containing protein 9-like [Brassica oleracea var. oleracea]
MGEVADTMTKKKKKGRPSLLDLQKRAIKQQQLQQQHHRNNHDDPRSASQNPNSPNSGTRSKRRNPNPNGVSSSDAPWIKDDDEEDDDERREKKHRLLHGLNSHYHRHSPNSQSGGSDLNLDETPEASFNRRKIGVGGGGSGFTGEKASKATDILQGSPVESGPTTPLPDKKLLVFILDRLQKKDTYGVYSDPVDPEELPDYHEIITNPMDFSTVRKKLDSGAYASLEQFEGDVFLICSNAMEYNSSDTVYYRQARAIQELAKKDFENLRQESDDEEPQSQQEQQQQQQQPKVARRGRPPKKQPEPSSIDRTASEISADALIPGGDSSNKFSGAYNLRKTPPSNKFRQAETSVRINHNCETQSGWSVDWENEFPPSVVKAVNKYGMKHFNVDDNRRDTYNHLSTCTQEPSVLTTLEDELKQLIPVGLNTEYGYARSLARYAANLGPVAWKIASKRIGTALPSGVKFGLGWVGDNPSGTEEDDDHQKQTLLGKQKCSNDLASDDHSNRILSPAASVSSAFIGNRHSSSAQGIEETAPSRVLVSEFPSSSSSRQAGPLIKPESSNRRFSGFSHSPSPMIGVTSQQQPNSTTEAVPGSQQQGLLFPYNKQEFHRFPPDLNARIVSPNSPGANQQTSSSSSQHPDLALQL